MILVELFSKTDCHLCQEVLSLLQRVQREVPFRLSEKKLEPGEELYELFKEKVPVILINGEEAFHGRVDEKAFRKILRRVVR
jgi:glutaredoxin